MIIENEKKHIISGDNFNTIKSKVNKNKLAKLYGILSHIYRNPIGSIVREYVSNAIDANNEAHHFKELDFNQLSFKYPWINEEHFNIDEEEINNIKKHLTKAGKNEPIIVSISPGRDELRIKDFGIGLSPERMLHIYFNYLDSTKEETDEQIGAFGIGSKSALSYTHTFFIDTVYNGKKYHYIMTKDEKGIPEGNLLNIVESGDFDNGTTIRIPIRQYDSSIFVKEIYKQLLYVDNVYFTETDNLVNDNNSFNTNYIVDGGEWKMACNSVINEMHICYNNILYTIDWSELGMQSINIPLGIVFKTGELQPTPSRESIVYSVNSINLIKKKIDVIKEYFRKKKEEEYNEEISIYEYINGNFNSDFKIDSNIKIDLSKLNLSFNNYNFKIKYFDDIPFYSYKVHLKTISARQLPYIIVAQMNYYNYTLRNFDYEARLSVNSIPKRYILLKKGEKINKAKAHYILSQNDKSNLEFIRKNPFDLTYYKMVLSLKSYPKDLWRKIIIAFQKSQQDKIEEKNIQNYSDILVNPNWYKDYKAGLTPYKKVTPTISKKLENINDIWISYKECGIDGVFRREGEYVKSLKKIKGLVFYESYDNEDLLLKMMKFLKHKSKIKFKIISISNTNVKKMKDLDLKNFYNLQEYLENKENKLIPNLITSAECQKLLNNIDDNNVILKYNSVLKKEYSDIKNYVNSNRGSYVQTHILEEFKEILGENAIIQEKLDKTKLLVEKCNAHPILEFISYNHLNYTNMFVIPEFLISLGIKVDNKYRYLKVEQKLDNFYNISNYGKENWEFINDV